MMVFFATVQGFASPCNNREVVSASGSVQQVTNYYPFGAPYADPAAVVSADLQPYKYNGKELDKMHGLNTYDYGARQYNPIVGRWDRMDPLCEKYYSISPYVYCVNNPVKYIDEHGDSCIVLIAPYAVKGLGHMAIGIQDEDKEWCLFSKNGTYENYGFSGKEGVPGTKKHNDRRLYHSHNSRTRLKTPRRCLV